MAAFYGMVLPLPLQAGVVDGLGHVSAEGVCVMSVRLFGLNNQPMVGQQIYIFNPPNTNIESDPIVIETDAQGYASVALERGREVEVSFLGTSFMRRIVVPDEPQADLLEVANLPAFDAFAIVRPDPIAAIRRS